MYLNVQDWCVDHCRDYWLDKYRVSLLVGPAPGHDESIVLAHFVMCWSFIVLVWIIALVRFRWGHYCSPVENRVVGCKTLVVINWAL